jgi:hypothetical protein
MKGMMGWRSLRRVARLSSRVLRVWAFPAFRAGLEASRYQSQNSLQMSS